MKGLLLLGLFSLAVCTVNGARGDRGEEEETRAGKLMSMFQVIRFKNEACEGGSGKNGTCYTASECEENGGMSSGTCAQGFGVCCTFSLKCGGTSNANNTYISSGTVSTGQECHYKICKCQENICRIRLDFNTFDIAGPVTDEPVALADAPPIGTGAAIGDCLVDSFTATCPGGTTPPTICGMNTGQHMIVDASSMCHDLTFNLMGDANSRQWDIKVTQYECGDMNAGPSGCLQYLTGAMGDFRSFAYDNSVPFVDQASTTQVHLSNQMYQICIRQEAGNCAICYTPAFQANAEDMQDSFGLSVSPMDDALMSATDSDCTTDFLMIPGGELSTNFDVSMTRNTNNVFCGRFLSSAIRTDNTKSVCTKQTPFTVGFVSDADEITDTEDPEMATLNELAGIPGGIHGFWINYAQLPC